MKLTHFHTLTFFVASIFVNPTFEQWAKWRESRRMSGDGFRPGDLADVINTTITPDINVPTDNWAGAVYEAPPQGQNFEAVNGVFRVPTASGTSSGVSIWIGIDGHTNDVVIQGGISINMDANRSPSYSSWTEWYPDSAVFYDQSTFSFAAGNVLSIGIVVLVGTTTATFDITNQSTNVSYSLEFSPSDPTQVAQGENVEWVVERTNQNTLMNFGTVVFSGAVAQTDSQSVDLSGADSLSIQRSPTDGTIIAAGQIIAPRSVQITYTGP